MIIIMWTSDICFANFYLNLNRTKDNLENNKKSDFNKK